LNQSILLDRTNENLRMLKPEDPVLVLQYGNFIWKDKITYTTLYKIHQIYILSILVYSKREIGEGISGYQIFYPKRRSGETRRPRRPQ
jgi:hypothetical protein